MGHVCLPHLGDHFDCLEEYKNTLLGRQIIMEMATNKEFFSEIQTWDAWQACSLMFVKGKNMIQSARMAPQLIMNGQHIMSQGSFYSCLTNTWSDEMMLMVMGTLFQM